MELTFDAQSQIMEIVIGTLGAEIQKDYDKKRCSIELIDFQSSFYCSIELFIG